MATAMVPTANTAEARTSHPRDNRSALEVRACPNSMDEASTSWKWPLSSAPGPPGGPLLAGRALLDGDGFGRLPVGLGSTIRARLEGAGHLGKRRELLLCALDFGGRRVREVHAERRSAVRPVLHPRSSGVEF